MRFALPSFGSKSVVGLDIGSSSVKAVELSRRGRSKEFELTHLGVAPMPAEAIVQGAFLNSSAIVEAIREAIEKAKIRTKNVAAAVSGHSVIVKKVSLPAMTRDELDEQIRWEAEQYIPFDVNEVNLDFQILNGGGGEGQMEVLLVAAKKDLVDDYVQVIREAGLVPAAIDVAAFAVENAFEANYDVRPDEVVALVNIGAQVVNINIISNGAPAFTRDITTAGNQYTEEIQKALVDQLRRGRAHQARRAALGEQPGGRAAGGRAGDALRHRDGDRGDQPVARLLLGHQRRQPHRAHRALRRRRRASPGCRRRSSSAAAGRSRSWTRWRA